jgi:hypothetical protein
MYTGTEAEIWHGHLTCLESRSNTNRVSLGERGYTIEMKPPGQNIGQWQPKTGGNLVRDRNEGKRGCDGMMPKKGIGRT